MKKYINFLANRFANLSPWLRFVLMFNLFSVGMILVGLLFFEQDLSWAVSYSVVFSFLYSSVYVFVWKK